MCIRDRKSSAAEIPKIDTNSKPPPRGYTGVSKTKFAGIEPFGGKPGSVSFSGITHHVVEGRKIVASPYKDGGGSMLWVLAPLVLISSLILPPIYLSNIFDNVFENVILAGN